MYQRPTVVDGFYSDLGVYRSAWEPVACDYVMHVHALRPSVSTERGVSPVNPCQLAGLRAMIIHAAPSIITDRSPGRPAKTARTAAEARARISSG
jgi:hypothetical protein